MGGVVALGVAAGAGTVPATGPGSAGVGEISIVLAGVGVGGDVGLPGREVAVGVEVGVGECGGVLVAGTVGVASTDTGVDSTVEVGGLSQPAARATIVTSRSPRSHLPPPVVNVLFARRRHFFMDKSTLPRVSSNILTTCFGARFP